MTHSDLKVIEEDCVDNDVSFRDPHLKTVPKAPFKSSDGMHHIAGDIETTMPKSVFNSSVQSSGSVNSQNSVVATESPFKNSNISSLHDDDDIKNMKSIVNDLIYVVQQLQQELYTLKNSQSCRCTDRPVVNLTSTGTNTDDLKPKVSTGTNTDDVTERTSTAGDTDDSEQVPKVNTELHTPDEMLTNSMDNVSHAINIHRSNRLDVKGSVFQGFCSKVSSATDILDILSIIKDEEPNRLATHIIYAYRLSSPGDSPRESCCDDGGNGGGGILLRLLKKHDIQDTLVVAIRWYGGNHLGKQRFGLLEQCVVNALLRTYFNDVYLTVLYPCMLHEWVICIYFHAECITGHYGEFNFSCKL